MHDLYDLVTGPLAWASFGIFILGSIYKLAFVHYLARTKDPTVLQYFDMKFGLRSILKWLNPFVPQVWRNNPAMTLVTFVFHICLILTPIFLSAHVLLFEEFRGWSWATLPDGTADIMTIVVMACGVFFIHRRLTHPTAQFVSSGQDWLVLAIVLLPFVTGFLAYHQIGDYKFMIILHILSGEIWLAAIPFTRLAHMLYAALTRAYIGSEFGRIRHAQDW